MSNILFETSPTDAATHIIVVCILLLVALAACVFPARQATCVEPQNALRAE